MLIASNFYHWMPSPEESWWHWTAAWPPQPPCTSFLGGHWMSDWRQVPALLVQRWLTDFGWTFCWHPHFWQPWWMKRKAVSNCEQQNYNILNKYGDRRNVSYCITNCLLFYGVQPDPAAGCDSMLVAIMSICWCSHTMHPIVKPALSLILLQMASCRVRS